MGFSRRGIGLGLAAAFVAAWLPRASAGAETKTISAVEVKQEAGVTRIVLRGAEDPIYTAFMRDDPPRLIVDLPDVVFDGVETPVAVNDGLVTDVTLGAFGDPRVSAAMGRVSIGLAAEAEYEVIPHGKELVVELRGSNAAAPTAAPAPAVAPAEPAPMGQEPAPAPVEPGAETPAPPVAEPASAEEVVDATPAPEAAPAPAPATAARKSKITKLVPVADGIEVVARGPIDNADSFALEGPDRLVVDFWGASSGVWPATLAPEQGVVSKVRVGEHADKVRVVLDLRSKLRSHSVVPTATGAKIVFDAETTAADSDAAAHAESAPAAPDPSAEVTPEAAPDQAAPAPPPAQAAEASAQPASEPASPPAPIADSADVQSVHFESLGEIDRVVISLSARLPARLATPDADTVIVDFPGARVTSEVERRVDTREFHGPIEVFSAFRSPEIDGDNLRVVLKRHGSATPHLTWDGTHARLELARGPEDGPAKTEPSGTEAAPETPAPDASSSTPGETAPETASSETPAAASEAQPAPAKPASRRAQPVSTEIPSPEAAGPADPAAIDLLEEGGFSQEKNYVGRRISLDFKDAEMGNILRLIAEVSDLNVIAGEEVAGKVTIRLVEVPWDQALDVILMTKGLGFMRIGNILRIAPLDVLQREEQARLQERRAKEKLEDLVVKLQPVNYAAPSEVQSLVKKLLSSRGTVNVAQRTSTLIIKDIPTVIQEATALVKAIDTQTPQVLIEAKVVEASLDFSRALGVRWGLGYNALGGTGGAPDFHLADGTNDVVPGFGSGGQGSNYLASLPVANSLGTLTLGLLGLDDRIQLDLELQSAESQSKGKVISSPRVVTLDNRQAKIQQGVAVKFEASDGDSVSTSFIDAVLELAVTPHITADRAIIMKIKVSRNAPQLNDVGDEVVGIAKNETQTEALVRDGQTMVLGGIYTVDKGSSQDKVPFLSDIPILGVAFRNTARQDERRELLIFVTPRVVQGEAPAS
jgi:type IV pilus assembly protein PilQ